MMTDEELAAIRARLQDFCTEVLSNERAPYPTARPRTQLNQVCSDINVLVAEVKRLKYEAFMCGEESHE